MFYVQRNTRGELIRVEASPYPQATQTLPSSHHEVQEWFADKTLEVNLKLLEQSDVEMIRVLDDLIQLLLDKRVIGVDDLPSAVQAKLHARNLARKTLPELNLLVEEDSGLI
ncbi:tryptophan synthase subunit beta [Pseudomonas fluorescens]|uniref:Tryptophan synthase subunit beta n=1 Tax=Pseudomonas fluorescens TaxID=294 RepID=A0A423LFU1_PSEFL|nr:tryptophan synthase subunit beta [Pseudomonas fluorescens]RON67159.1 tryptophan synthase subunit beta [Pseudomonas fluorescens]